MSSEPLYHRPTLSRAHFSFIQDPNTLGTTDAENVGSEDLEVFLEYQLPGGDGDEGWPFIVIQSKSGWSVNEIEELANMVNGCVECHRLLSRKPGVGKGEESE